MTIEIENLLQSFEEWTSFTRSLQILEVEVWDSSIEVGKWSIKEIITHITLWDKYFYEEAIAKIATNQPLSLAHLDYDEFNSKAITYSRTITTDELIEKAGIYRQSNHRCNSNNVY